MTYRSDQHSWAFLLESEYDPADITLRHYQQNALVYADSGTAYRCLEWIGTLLEELDSWDVFQTAQDAKTFLERN